MGFWANLGENAAIGLVKGTIGAGFSALDRYQNYIYGEKAANAADARQRAQWEDMYSWSAQMRDLKNAGLNPSLVMGKPSGQGGATAPQGGGAMGVTSGYAPIDPMTSAQLELLKSQANVNNAEANNLNKDSQNKVQLLENLKQEFKTEEQQTLIAKADAEVAQNNAYLSSANLNNNLAASTANLEILAKTMLQLDNAIQLGDIQVQFNEATFDAHLAQVYADLSLTQANTQNIKALTGLTYQQVQLVIQQTAKTHWETWAIEKEQNRKDAYFKLDDKKVTADIQKWIHESNIELKKAQIQALTSMVTSAMGMFKFSFSNGNMNTISNSTVNSTSNNRNISTSTVDSWHHTVPQ